MKNVLAGKISNLIFDFSGWVRHEMPYNSYDFLLISDKIEANMGISAEDNKAPVVFDAMIRS